MPNVKKATTITLGKYSDGEMMLLPLDLTVENLEAFISGLTVKQRIELSCVIEYLLSGANENKENNEYPDELENVHYFLLEGLKSTQFLAELDSLNLFSSIERIKYGKTLMK